MIDDTALSDDLNRQLETAVNVFATKSQPNSLGSANHASQQRSYYEKSKSDSPAHLATEEPDSRLDRAGSSTEGMMSRILTQLRAQAAAMQELQRVVQDLQVLAVDHEGRLSNLESQWQHQELVEPTLTEYYSSTQRGA